MTPLERLRLAAALGHTVPGAELRLRTHRNENVLVSHHPAADVDPCVLRRVVAASAGPGQPDISEHIAEVVVGGALNDLGGGVYASSAGGVEQRWIATLLQPQCVADLLDSVGLDAIPENSMSAHLKPDSCLGVTMLAVTVTDARFHHALDEVGARVAATCFVEELRCGAADLAPSRSNDLTGGPR